MAATEYQEEWDLGCVAMKKLKEAGVRVIPAATTASSGAPRRVREGHRALRHRHGLHRDGGHRGRHEARLGAAADGAPVRHGRGGQVRRPGRRRRRPARRHRDPPGPHEARHGDEGRQGEVNSFGLPQELPACPTSPWTSSTSSARRPSRRRCPRRPRCSTEACPRSTRTEPGSPSTSGAPGRPRPDPRPGRERRRRSGSARSTPSRRTSASSPTTCAGPGAAR